MPVYDIDATDYDPESVGIVKEGTHYVEVAAVDLRRSSGGEQMLSLKLTGVNTKRVVAFDNIMLGGEGRFMGIAKLEQLGCKVEAGKLRVESEKLLGKRLAVSIKHEEYQGKRRGVVDIRAKAPFRCGYLAEEAAMEAGLIGAAASAVVKEETPF